MLARKFASLFPLPALFIVGALCFDDSETDYGDVHPNAPKETEELGFLIGRWKLETHYHNNPATPFVGEAFLEARYILNGFGIQMTEEHTKGPYQDPREPIFRSTVVFVFDTDSKKWAGASVNSLGNRKQLDGTFEDGKLVLIQSGKLFQNRKGINRQTFFDISEDHFSFQTDASLDGETWKERTYSYEATRLE